MAVYTRLTKEDIAAHLENYTIGSLVSFKEIVDGIDNSNFIIETDQDRFILTIFEERISKEELPFFINLKLHLARKGICCPRPIVNKLGQSIAELKGKKASIVSFLNGAMLQAQDNGYYASIKPKHCFEIGVVLAKLHEAAADFDMSRNNELGVREFRGFFSGFENKTKDYQAGLSEEILENLSLLENCWRDDLPKAAIHADLFPDNVFFGENDTLSGVIDFYFAANDMLIYDLAIGVNAWCFDENNLFVEEKFEQMLKGYTSIRVLSSQEMEFLHIASLGASLRFLLTRLYDLFGTPEGSLVKVKDPQEYVGKMRYFRSKIG